MRMSPPGPANVHSLGTLASPTGPFPMVQDRRRPAHPLWAWASFSRDNTHPFRDIGWQAAVVDGRLLKRPGGLPARSLAVRTTSCRAALIAP